MDSVPSKRCSKCGEAKPPGAFYASRPDCKQCRDAAHARYVEANRERVREYRRRFYEANRSKIQESNRDSAREQRQQHHPSTEDGVTTKRCGSCGEVKPLDAFHKSKRDRRGHHRYCKECRARMPRPQGSKTLRTHLSKLIEAQAGKCAICGDAPENGSLCLDHDHATGELRAALCRRCNTVLGSVRDSPVLLRSMAHYLSRYGST